MSAKLDFKKELKQLYQPPSTKFVDIEVPELTFVMVDGEGDPNTADAYPKALEWLYSTSYAMKFSSKNSLDLDYVVPPLEGLWWADNPADFVARNKAAWKWTMMIMVPEFVTDDMYATATEKAMAKLGTPPSTLRLESFCEGLCLQTMHIGSYDDEGPTLAKLHDQIMPKRRLAFNGPHHEIYIGDPRRVQPDRLKTVLRQPVT
ncbi:MAG: hypothetical protein HKN30_06920 [Sulfitobacter sp.]|nr:hypothetical protein [Sulfitobacter sp.]